MAFQKLNEIFQSYRRLLLMVALNVPLIIAILLFSMRNVEFSAMTWVYFLTVTLGYYTLIILAAVTLAFLLFFYFRKFAVITAISAVTFAVFFLIIDGATYKVTNIHIDPFWMEWIINDFDAFGISAATMRAVVLCLIGLILLEIFIFFLAGKLSRRKKSIALIFALVSVLSFAASQTIHLIAYEKNVTHITSLTPYFPLYYPVTSHKNAAKYGDLLSIDNEDASYVSDDQTKTLSYPLNELKFKNDSTAAGPNILVILFESWRTDAMTPEVTPNTYELSTKSTVCLDHFCSGNSTVAGIFGLFYGLYPTYWSTVKADNAIIDNPVLIDVLKEKGYTFGIFAKSNFKRHKIKDAVFRGIEIHKSFAGDGIMEQDQDMTRQVIGFLKDQKTKQNPFMALAFYKSNHAPYVYPPEDTIFRPAGDQNLMLAGNDTDPSYYYNDYLNATHYVDRMVGAILKAADSLGLMSNTVIIVTTDHAEEFNDNHADYWGHGTNYTKYQTMVPMIIHAPGHEPVQIKYRTSHVDVVPTIMKEFLGCTNDVSDYSNGQDLYDLDIESRPLVIGSYINHAFVIDSSVYEIYPIQTKSYSIYDINAKVSKPPFVKVKTLFDEISRFYQDDNNTDSAISRKDDSSRSGIAKNP